MFPSLLCNDALHAQKCQWPSRLYFLSTSRSRSCGKAITVLSLIPVIVSAATSALRMASSVACTRFSVTREQKRGEANNHQSDNRARPVLVHHLASSDVTWQYKPDALLSKCMGRAQEREAQEDWKQKWRPGSEC